jgi:hypothetical protein
MEEEHILDLDVEQVEQLPEATGYVEAWRGAAIGEMKDPETMSEERYQIVSPPHTSLMIASKTTKRLSILHRFTQITCIPTTHAMESYPFSHSPSRSNVYPRSTSTRTLRRVSSHLRCCAGEFGEVHGYGRVKGGLSCVVADCSVPKRLWKSLGEDRGVRSTSFYLWKRWVTIKTLYSMYIHGLQS